MALLAAGDQPWKDKQIPEWSEADAQQVLTDSPWAKTVQPTIDRSANNGQRRSGGGMGRGGGISIGGIGIGLPGMGRERPGVAEWAGPAWVAATLAAGSPGGRTTGPARITASRRLSGSGGKAHFRFAKRN